MWVYEQLNEVAHQVELAPMMRAAGRRLDGILAVEVARAVAMADQIVMIESAEVVAAGPHDRLVVENERSADFWESRERSAGLQFGRPAVVEPR